MSDFTQSSDKYYKGKDVPIFKETKEGRVKKRPAFIYQHKQSDSSASSDKYYKAPASEDSVKKIVDRKAIATIEVTSPQDTLVSIISSFSAGFNTVMLKVKPSDIQKVRTSIDMAVGRNTLTRAQADSIFIVATLPEPLVEQTETFSSHKKKRGKKAKNAPVESFTPAAEVDLASFLEPEVQLETRQEESLPEISNESPQIDPYDSDE